MQYTEEHYAQMYNGLPEGLKDLVLSGRLAILVSAIGSRHGLSADQIADLEPAIEDVCLGLITKDELVENIRKSTDVDMRVANRIAAEAELEILKPYEAELLISRKQKEELDEKIVNETRTHPVTTSSSVKKTPAVEPKNVSEHAQIKKVSDWYSKDEQSFKDEDAGKTEPTVTNFDWEKDFGKHPTPTETIATSTEENAPVPKNIEEKLDQLTESINKIVNTRFGDSGKEGTELSSQMQELVKRLEKAEKENQENKKLIESLKGVKPVESIFGNMPTSQAGALNTTNIPIDKERKVEINHADKVKKEVETGNIQITSVSTSIPIQKKDSPKNVQEVFSSAVSKDTLDSIVATRNKVTPIASENTSVKKVLSMDELVKDGDKKIKETLPPKNATLVFPGLNDETKLDIKNLAQKDSIKQTLLDDLEFLKNDMNKSESSKANIAGVTFPNNSVEGSGGASGAVANQNTDQDDTQNTKAKSQNNLNSSSTYATNPFKDELIPKTKEERMRVLQEKIKALNKGVGVGGKTNLSASGLDPYRL